jgi:mRNA interferase YafQ
LYIIKTTNRFQKDYKRLLKAGDKNIDLLKNIMHKLINEEKLEPNYRDHVLIGNYKDRRECHIKPDWLLIYKLEGDVIIFERTGNHSELFK